MFTALSRIGRAQAAQGRRSLGDCQRWEQEVWETTFPP